jgi:hypothetical protein
MDKNVQLPGMEKHEVLIGQFKDYNLTQLVARRLHNFYNDKERGMVTHYKTMYGYKKVSFIVSSGNGHSDKFTHLFIGCKTPISDTMKEGMKVMAARFAVELKPYFGKNR